MKIIKKVGPNTVPTEVLCDVLHYLEPRDLGICAFVCRRWKIVITNTTKSILPSPSNSWYMEQRREKKRKIHDTGVKISSVIIWILYVIASILQLSTHGFQTIIEFLANGRSSKYLFNFIFLGLIIWYFIFLIICELIVSMPRGISMIPIFLVVPYILTHDTQIITLFFDGAIYDYFINFVFLLLFSCCCCCCCFSISNHNLPFEQVVIAWGMRFFFLYSFDFIIQMVWHACAIHSIKCYNCTINPELASCRKLEDPNHFPKDNIDSIWLFYTNWYWVSWVVIGSFAIISIGVLIITKLLSKKVIPKILNV